MEDKGSATEGISLLTAEIMTGFLLFPAVCRSNLT